MEDNTKLARRFFFEQFVGFHAQPDDRVQEIYAKAMIQCAKGDGILHEKERDWIRGYFASTGAPDHVMKLVDTYEGGEDLSEVLSGDERTAKMAARNLVFDALRVCEADGELAPAELEKIHAMGKAMGLDEGAIRQVEAAYHVYKAAFENKMAVLFPGAAPFQD